MAATLNVRPRSVRGKNAARKLRQSGFVPAVIYGHGDETRAVEIALNELERLLSSISVENTLIDLKVAGGGVTSALIREVQHHPVKPVILHVDFLQVHAGEVIRLQVPVRLHGNAIGVREGGGVLQEAMHDLEVECLPRDIPEAVDIDVENLNVGDSVHVRDISLPNVTVLNDPDLVIVSITTPTTAALPEDAEAAGTEPEVITKREAGESE